MDLLAAAENVLAELESRYDGAPDSRTLWMGSHITDLEAAIRKAKAWQLAREDAGRCRPLGF